MAEYRDHPIARCQHGSIDTTIEAATLFCNTFRISVAWGMVAITIAFWANLLCEEGFPEMWNMLLITPIVEEIAKYLGLRRTGSIVIPIVFLIGESVVQSSGYLLRDPWMIWLFYIPLGLVIFKHLLFYVIVYVCDFRIHGLLFAVVAHAAWNWYSIAAKGQDMIPLSIIALAITVFPLWALYKRENEIGNQ